MTPEQYRTHPSLALRRAFLRGELVGVAGAATVENPYRRQASDRSPRRRSWSEAFVRAWAAGKAEGDRQRSQLAAVERGRALAAAERGGAGEQP